MDPFTMPIAGMIFILLFVAIVGGLMLLRPVAARLGGVSDPGLTERQAASLASADEVDELRRTVEELQTELARLAEQQQFTERLLEDRSSAGSSGAGSSGDWAAESD
jgi:hypothetical protein